MGEGWRGTDTVGSEVRLSSPGERRRGPRVPLLSRGWNERRVSRICGCLFTQYSNSCRERGGLVVTHTHHKIHQYMHTAFTNQEYCYYVYM